MKKKKIRRKGNRLVIISHQICVLINGNEKNCKVSKGDRKIGGRFGGGCCCFYLFFFKLRRSGHVQDRGKGFKEMENTGEGIKQITGRKSLEKQQGMVSKDRMGEGISPRNKNDHTFLKAEEREGDKRPMLDVKEERCTNL